MTERDSKLIDITATLRHQTANAFLIYDGAKEVWLPKSQVEYFDNTRDEIFTMPEWLAKAKGLV